MAIKGLSLSLFQLDMFNTWRSLLADVKVKNTPLCSRVKIKGGLLLMATYNTIELEAYPGDVYISMSLHPQVYTVQCIYICICIYCINSRHR